MQLALKSYLIVLFVLVFSSGSSIAQQSRFNTYMKNNTLNLEKLAVIDSIKEVAEMKESHDAYLANMQEHKIKRRAYFDRMNTSLYKLFEKLDTQGLKGFNSNDYEISTYMGTYNDSLQLNIIVNGRVNYQGVTSLFNLGNIEHRFPRAWKLVKDRKMVFVENADEYQYDERPLVSSPGGLTLPKIPSHLARTGTAQTSENEFRIAAEEFGAYIIDYFRTYGCNGELMHDLQVYEDTQNPKSWRNKLYARRMFVDFMHEECKK
jgi:hypothetical protein